MSGVAKKATASSAPKKSAPAAAAPKPAVAKAGSSKKRPASAFHKEHSHLFPKNPRSYGIGRSVQHASDLSRFVKWPRYVRIQRQRAILKKRLKVPPALNQFTRAVDKNQASTLFRLLSHYRPESSEEKAKRLKAKAEAGAKGKAAAADVSKTEKPLFIKYGLNHITQLVESKKAKLVVIAHDVDPIELVVWLPALCRKMDVPYVIVKSKARLGHLVHKKTTSVLAVTEVRREDVAKLEQVVSNARLQFNDNAAERRRWGGGIMGSKAQAVIKKRERAHAREAASKV
jgi:large subunit ribosomal protein L7Ae